MAIPSGAHRGTGEWWSAARAWAAAGPWRRVRGWWSAPNGRVAVTLALLLGSERNQGWRAVRRGHADDAAAWFVSFGRVWRAPTPSVPRRYQGGFRSEIRPEIKPQNRFGASPYKFPIDYRFVDLVVIRSAAILLAEASLNGGSMNRKINRSSGYPQTS